MIISIILTIQLQAIADIALPIASDIQLQQLINKSEQQVQTLNKILKNAKADRTSLERAAKTLESLSAGIDQSIKQYQGTEAYERALIKLQSKEGYKNTYSASQSVRDQITWPIHGSERQDEAAKEYRALKQFQKDSVKANQSDLDRLEKLEKALLAAKPGFVPKIQAEAELGNWKSNTRVSAQITELLAAIHAMREELRAQRLKSSTHKDAINVFLSGSELQNEKQKTGQSK